MVNLSRFYRVNFIRPYWVNFTVFSNMAPEATAIRIKDALKFGMLMWWYGGKDAPLFQYYQILFGNALDDLRSKLIGSHTERPYRML